jgi:hypothetical protein
MGYKKYSDKEERRIVEEYRNGAPVKMLMERYGFATKKSITDKVKKYYPNNYKVIIEEAKNNRKGYCYKLEKINNEFDAYYLGLLLTDGYLVNDSWAVGIDLTDEDCIDFLSKSIGKDYKTYEQTYSREYHGHMIQGRQPRHRLIIEDKDLVHNLTRLGVVQNKSKILQGPQLLPEEEKYIPYIIRGVIDGDGTVSPTSYGGAQFRIVTASYDFAVWLKSVLENKMYMIDILITESYRPNGSVLYVIGTADQGNILKLISMSYNKPFGMARKYEKIRKTFRDYNKDLLLEENV